MTGDITRSTFDPKKRYRSVRMQQGRVQLDADWNEQSDLNQYYLEKSLGEVVGVAGVMVDRYALEPTIPLDKADFDLHFKDQNPPTEEELPLSQLEISKGKCVVNGILCENDADVQFDQQPGHHDATESVPKKDGVAYLVYLDVSSRDISALEDPTLKEVALGGVDTTTRTKTVWRAKHQEVALDHEARDKVKKRGLPDNWENPDTPVDLSELNSWHNLSTSTVQMRIPDRVDTWRGENQLYRVEIHHVEGNSIFIKWSRENGSVAFPIRGIQECPSPAQTTFRLTLGNWTSLHPALAIGDWIEISDKDSVRSGIPFPLCRVIAVHAAEGAIEIEKTTDEMFTTLAKWANDQAALPPTTNNNKQGCAELEANAQSEKLHADGQRIVRRWDMPDTGQPVSTGTECRLIPDPATNDASCQIPLEKDLTVQFENKGEQLKVDIGDYWQIPARSDKPIAEATLRPPDGPLHSYAPLALLYWNVDKWAVRQGLERFATGPALTTGLRQTNKDVDDTNKRLDETNKKLSDLTDYVHKLEERLVYVEQKLKELTFYYTHLVDEFISTDDLQVGDVVAVIPGNCDRITLGSRANSLQVVGVVTGAPRAVPETGPVLLSKQGKLKKSGGAAPPVVPYPSHVYPVGIYGVMQCKVEGDIEPGDMVVPSKRPGYARRHPVWFEPYVGKIIGKALEGHGNGTPEEEDTIAVLVTIG